MTWYPICKSCLKGMISINNIPKAFKENKKTSKCSMEYAYREYHSNQRYCRNKATYLIQEK